MKGFENLSVHHVSNNKYMISTSGPKPHISKEMKNLSQMGEFTNYTVKKRGGFFFKSPRRRKKSGYAPFGRAVVKSEQPFFGRHNLQPPGPKTPSWGLTTASPVRRVIRNTENPLPVPSEIKIGPNGLPIPPKCAHPDCDKMGRLLPDWWVRNRFSDGRTKPPDHPFYNKPYTKYCAEHGPPPTNVRIRNNPPSAEEGEEMEVEEEEEDKPLALRKDPNFRVDFDDGVWKVYQGGQRIHASSLASSDGSLGSLGSFPGGVLAPGPSAGIRFGNVLT